MEYIVGPQILIFDEERQSQTETKRRAFAGEIALILIGFVVWYDSRSR